MVLKSTQSRGWNLGLQPAMAWTAILGFVLISALGILAGAGSIVRLIYPVGAFVVAVFLYRKYPILYLGFTWWLWFLTPWVRRLIDFRSGWTEPSIVLLAPFLATLVTLATFIQYLPKLYRRDGLPFFLSFIGVIYGCLIGLINSRYGLDSRVIEIVLPGETGMNYSIISVLVKTLDWITPILFSFHLFVNWKNYPEYRQNMQRTFCWGVLVMGLYGIVQYLVAPEWDRFWLLKVQPPEGRGPFGNPEPLGIRVFSTMNSPGPFAVTMMGGLLLLFTGQGTLRFFAAATGYLTFLLTLVRAVWGGWFISLLIFSSSLKAHLQMRLIITILVIGICVLPLTTIEPFSEVISSRTQTLTNVKKDGSFKDRTGNYERALAPSLLQPLGNGLGLPGVDSAIIDVFMAIGWLGAIPYLGGLFMLVIKLLGCRERRFDSFMSAASAICFAQILMLIFGNGLIGVSGILLWGFLGISLAAHKYYQHQSAERKSSP
jgi:hypothetical protein